MICGPIDDASSAAFSPGSSGHGSDTHALVPYHGSTRYPGGSSSSEIPVVVKASHLGIWAVRLRWFPVDFHLHPPTFALGGEQIPHRGPDRAEQRRGHLLPQRSRQLVR